MTRLPSQAALNPFVAPLLRKASNVGGKILLNSLVDEISSLIQSSHSTVRTVSEITNTEVTAGVRFRSIEYLEERAPSWSTDASRKDHVHQLVICAVRGRFAAICVSDTALRAKLTHALIVAAAVAPAIIEQAFVSDRATVMWLTGVHTPTDVRPNAKTLSGNDLAYALDPIGDQTFAYSAVRTNLVLDVQGQQTQSSIGAAPGAGRIWLKRAKSWSEYAALIRTVIDGLENPLTAKVKFKSLAKAVNSLAAVSHANDMLFLPPEIMADDGFQEEDREKAARWADATEFKVHALKDADFTADVKFEGNKLGTVEVSPSMIDGRVKLAINWKTKPAKFATERATCSEFLADPKWTKIYYDSAHTIAQGRCFTSEYVDQPFEWSWKDFTGYDIHREKPVLNNGQTLASTIGQGGDKSLFSYVLETVGKDGWLACDDGSMEFADFVHISPERVVTLIHAKASNKPDKTRQVSVSNFEIVVGQAVKNLRHLERIKLYDALVKGKHRQVRAATWKDGVPQPDRTGIIDYAQTLGDTYQRRLVVLQPQLTQREHSHCIGMNDGSVRLARLRQLETLMLSARLSASSIGATFECWVDATV